MSKFKTLGYVCGLIILGIIYYLFLPPINPTAIEFWMFLGVAIVIFLVINLSSVEYEVTRRRVSIIKAPKYFKVIAFLIPAMVILLVVTNIIVSPLFNAKSCNN